MNLDFRTGSGHGVGIPAGAATSERPRKRGETAVGGRDDEESRLMDEFGIGFDGRWYRYREYRYDRLADAVNYARLERDRDPGWVKPRYVPPQHSEFESPGAAEQQLMAELDISFDGRQFIYGSYRYDRCGDAINYARLEKSLRR